MDHSMYDALRAAWRFSDNTTLTLGAMRVNDTLLTDAPVNLVLKSLNRHGLIAGATGSGKTKTIQVLCEQLSENGVPCVVMDIKGDISGLGMPGNATEALLERAKAMNLPFNPHANPVEFFCLGEGDDGVPLRSTIASFGPVLFSRMLDLNDTQSAVMTVLFEYAKACTLPLIDLEDLKSLMRHVQGEAGRADLQARFSGVSTSSLDAIARKLIELDAQGGDHFFGEPPFDINDFLRTDPAGHGVLSIIRLINLQDKPALFSTCMIKLLSDVYRTLPEIGDPEKPRLVLFLDEAHLLFAHAGKALMQLLDTTVKLIRSKGVGIVFCTQSPNDIPEAIASQLGLKIQHALRAFTAKDRKAMKLVAENFPPSEFYKTEDVLMTLGIGDALVCALDAKGQPTPLVQCAVRPPESRMGPLEAGELKSLLAVSPLMARYDKRVERTSAHEILATPSRESPPSETTDTQSAWETPAVITAIGKSTLFRQLVRQFFRQMTNTLLKILTGKRP